MKIPQAPVEIVCISDTHERHREIDIPCGDIIICAGDISMAGDHWAIKDFLEWFSDLGHRHKILIAGNHDYLFEKDSFGAKDLCRAYGVKYLCDEGITLDGWRFWGSPWTPRFYDWAFNVDRGSKIRRKWDLIPESTDILITHGPPWEVLDISGIGGLRVGCEELAIAVQRVKPRLHVFGHIHASYGVIERNGTTFVNAAVLDEAYYPTKSPIVVELE